MDKLQKQLDHMLKDTRYWRPKDTFKDFVNDIFCKDINELLGTDDEDLEQGAKEFTR